jgi:hypothetical protein
LAQPQKHRFLEESVGVGWKSSLKVVANCQRRQHSRDLPVKRESGSGPLDYSLPLIGRVVIIESTAVWEITISQDEFGKGQPSLHAGA